MTLSTPGKPSKEEMRLLKTEFEKAYDCLDWSFIRQVLTVSNFSTLHFVRSTLVCKYSKARNRQKFLILFFADDLFSGESLWLLLTFSILKSFCDLSRQKISHQKFKSLFSAKHRSNLLSILQVSKSKDLGTYLWVSIFRFEV